MTLPAPEETRQPEFKECWSEVRTLSLGRWRGGLLRADGEKNSSSGLPDVFQAFRQQLGITLVKLDVVRVMLGTT